MPTTAPEAKLPWIPAAVEDPTAGALAPALAAMLAATILIVAAEAMRDRQKRDVLRRYCLARHRVVRAGFYRFLGGGPRR